METKENVSSIEIICRGCTIGPRERTWESFVSSNKCGGLDNSYLIFEYEPTNRYDPNAIKIISKGEIFGTVGYVGREYTSKVKEIIDKHGNYRIDIKDEDEVGSREIGLILSWK